LASEVEGVKDLDKSHTSCKLCRIKLKYFGNTTHLRSHITRFHPEEEKHSAVPVVVIILIYYKYAASSGTHLFSCWFFAMLIKYIVR